VGAGIIAVIGIVVFAGQQGLLGSHAQRLYAQGVRAQQQDKLPEAQARLEELVATFPESPWMDDALLRLGQVYEIQQQLVEARTMYQSLMDRFADSPLVAEAQQRLGGVNIALLFSPVITDLDDVHVVITGDTLGRIASVNGTTVEFLKRANGLAGDIIRPGQKLKVPTGTFEVVVDKSQNQLLLTENNRFIKAYTVSTGTNNSTPVGSFKVVTKVPNPVWYTQGAVVPPDSPENILGTRWLGIDKQGYGIHGTTDPGKLGQQVTAGCVRMLNADVEELFTIVPVGTNVTIVD